MHASDVFFLDIKEELMERITVPPLPRPWFQTDKWVHFLFWNSLPLPLVGHMGEPSDFHSDLRGSTETRPSRAPLYSHTVQG